MNRWARELAGLMLAVVALLFTSACSSPPDTEGPVEQTAEPLTPPYCSSTNMPLTGPGTTSRTTPSSFYFPGAITVSSGTPSFFTAHVAVTVNSGGTNYVCGYNFSANNGVPEYDSPVNSCTGHCIYTVCPQFPTNHHFTNVTNISYSLTRVAGFSSVVTNLPLWDNPSDDGNVCTDDTCSGTTPAHNPVPGRSCADTNYCNGFEVCGVDAGCQTAANVPDGGIVPGTTGSCAGPTTCDGIGGTKAGVPLPAGTPCADTNVCDGLNTCNGLGACSPAGAPPTLQANTCNAAACDTTNGFMPTFDAGACPGPGAPSAINGSSPSTIGTSNSFIFLTQSDAGATIDPTQAGVIRGQVFDTSGNPKSGVTVSLLGHSEYGSVTTRSDGWFDMEVNAGGEFIVEYTDPTGSVCGSSTPCIRVQRHVQTRWNAYAIADDVVMTARATATAITAGGGYAHAQSATPGNFNDGDGVRHPTLIIPSGTSSTDPALSGVSTYHIAPTELTVSKTSAVGNLGPKAMPGDLPPASGYTHAVDFDLAEADSAGLTTVTFNQPMYYYIEQPTGITGLNNGDVVPMGYYDRAVGNWVASANGQVLTFTASSSTCVDGAGSGCPDILPAELTELHNAFNPITGTTPTKLWRVPIMHFTGYDANWGFGPPAGSGTSTAGPVTTGGGTPNSCQQQESGGSSSSGSSIPQSVDTGSFIECQNQSLDESIPVADTPFSLNYASRRSQYGNNRVQIPITGSTMPSLLPSEIDVIIQIAGRRERFTEVAPYNLNQTVLWTWDRLDAYGRFLQGAQHASVEVDYVYPGSFASTSTFGAYGTGTGISGSRAGRTINLYRTYDVVVGGVDQDLLGFGGWTLSPAHVFDLGSGLLERGDGSMQVNRDIGKVKTVAGNRQTSPAPTDGAAATSVKLKPSGIAVGHDGSLYVSDDDAVNLYQVLPNGLIYRIAGNNGSGSAFANGVPAVGAPIAPYGIAVDSDDSIVVQDAPHGRIVRISAPPGHCSWPSSCSWTSRTVSLVAGTLGGTTVGHLDGPVASATIGNTGSAVAVGRDGTIYFGDYDSTQWRLRRVLSPSSTSAYVETIAGNSVTSGGCQTSQACALGFSADAVTGVAVDSLGSVFFSNSGDVVRKITPDGYVAAIAGPGGSGTATGDNGPAISATLGAPGNLAVDSHDRLYISDRSNCLIRTVGPDGIIQRYAGLVASGSNCLARTDPLVDGAAPQATEIAIPDYLAIGPDDSITFANHNFEAVRTVAGLGGEFLIPSPDGSEVYSFSNGLHVETKSGLTGAGLYYFCYDTSQLLSKVIDETCAGEVTDPITGCAAAHTGCETTIGHSYSGTPPMLSSVTITSPFSKGTTLSVSSGMATSAVYALDATTNATYSLGYSMTDLLSSFADPGNFAAGKHHALTYGLDAFLIQDQDPLQLAASPMNAGTKLARTWSIYGWNVDVTTGEGHVRHLGIDHTPTTASPELREERTSVLADGTKYVEDWNNDDSKHFVSPDGTITDTSFRPDPRLGWDARYASLTTTTTALGTRTRKEYRTIPACTPPTCNPNNPFSAGSETDYVEINPTSTTKWDVSACGTGYAFDCGKFATRSVTYGATPVVTYTSAVGRSVTETFDSLGRVTKIQVPGISDVTIGYTTTAPIGAVDHVSQGSRTRQNALYGEHRFASVGHRLDRRGHDVQYLRFGRSRDEGDDAGSRRRSRRLRGV